jgi:hypothetical protein
MRNGVNLPKPTSNPSQLKMLYRNAILRVAYACLAIPLMFHPSACHAHIFSFLGSDDPPNCDVPCDSLYGDRLSGQAFLFRLPGQCSSDLRLNFSDPLVTDRPDFTEASRTVGRGVTQLEFGYTYRTDDDAAGSSDYHTLPELIIRRGFFRDWLELRLGYSATTGDIDGASVSGSEDLYLGIKIGLTAQRGLVPEMALLPQMTVPTGAGSLTADTTLGGLNLIYSWDVNCSLKVAGSTQFNREIDDGTAVQYTEWAQSFAVNKSLTRTIGVYGEWYAFVPDGADTNRVEHYVNGGLTKLFGNNVQWDVRAGAGVNDAADDFFIGTGLSVRYL